MNTKDIMNTYKFYEKELDNIKDTMPKIYEMIGAEHILEQQRDLMDISENNISYMNKLKSISMFDNVKPIGYNKAISLGIDKDEYGHKVVLSKYNQYNLHTRYIINNEGSIEIKRHIRLFKKPTEEDIKNLIQDRLKNYEGYDCITCNEMFDEHKYYIQHCESSKHKKRIYGLDTIKDNRCELCDISCSNVYKHIRSYNHTIKYIMKYIIFDEQKEIYNKLYNDIFGHQDIDNINFYSEKAKYNLIKFMELIRINTGDIPFIFCLINSKTLYQNSKNKKYIGNAIKEIDFIDMYDENVNIPYNYKYIFEHDVQKTRDNKYEFQLFTQYAEMYINKFYDSIDSNIKRLINKELENKNNERINKYIC